MAQYFTFGADAFAEIVVKKSRFIAGVYFCDKEEKALQILKNTKSDNKGANHNVYAYVLREGSKEKCSDDGEPAKTAGLPILDIIKGEKLCDVLVVVTRYFGGTLLGTGGLVRAYGDAARAGIGAGEIVTVQECVQINISIDYFLYEQTKRIILQENGKIISEDFAQNVKIQLVCVLKDKDNIKDKLCEISSGKALINVLETYFARF